MRRLSAAVLLALGLLSPIRPVVEPSATVEFVNPRPIPSYKARSTRSRARVTLTLSQLPDKWQRLAWCESRHRLHAVNNHTYYGLWQIHKGWFKPFNINPKTATLAQQYRVARHVYATQGARAWTCSRQSKFK